MYFGSSTRVTLKGVILFVQIPFVFHRIFSMITPFFYDCNVLETVVI